MGGLDVWCTVENTLFKELSNSDRACGMITQLAEELRARGEVKGEIALVIAPPSEDEEAGIVPVGAAAADPDEALREDIRAALEEGEPASAVAKRLSQKYSRRKRDVYAMVLDMQ